MREINGAEAACSASVHEQNIKLLETPEPLNSLASLIWCSLGGGELSLCLLGYPRLINHTTDFGTRPFCSLVRDEPVTISHILIGLIGGWKWMVRAWAKTV